jgi:2-haloacid dehalogenase
VISPDDVDTLLFDVLGTVVDEAGSMHAELAAALDQAGAGGQAGLAGRFAIVALSNGNLSMLTDMFAAGGLTWHCVLSGEMVHAYKPDPAVYRLALDRLALDPGRTLMVAAHPWDLRAAAAEGLRTAYIQRAGEGVPEPSDTFDLAVPDLAALAAGLVTKA